VANSQTTSRKAKRTSASQTPVNPTKFGLRGVLRTLAVGILVGIGSLSLVAYIGIHWTERQVLTTNNWVTMIAPLPQNPVVATALSNYAVEQLYSAVDVTQVIQDALPPKAAFLAAPLSGQLKSLAISTGQKVVVSDQFNQVWVAVNRTVNGSLIAIGRSTPAQPPAGTSVKVGKVNLIFNLSDLNKLLTQHLGAAGSGVFSDISKQVSTIQVNLKSTASQIREYFTYIDFANAILPYLTLAALVAAIAVALNRRRAVLGASVTIMVLSLLQLIGLRSARPAILNTIQNTSYRPAVNVIYSTVVHSFNEMVIIALIIATVIFIGTALLTGPGRLAALVASWSFWKWLRKSEFGRYVGLVRAQVTHYRLQIWGVGALIALVALAFWIKVNWTSITQVVLSYLIFMSIVQLLRTPRPRVLRTTSSR
jgi:hypothetical protein